MYGNRYFVKVYMIIFRQWFNVITSIFIKNNFKPPLAFHIITMDIKNKWDFIAPLFKTQKNLFVFKL